MFDLSITFRLPIFNPAAVEDVEQLNRLDTVLKDHQSFIFDANVEHRRNNIVQEVLAPTRGLTIKAPSKSGSKQVIIT